MEIDVKGILEKNKEMLVAQLETITKEQLKAAMEYQANDVVREAVNEFMEKEIAPALKKQLKEYKAVVLAELAVHLEKIVAEIGKKMFEVAKENMASSYKFQQMTKALFE